MIVLVITKPINIVAVAGRRHHSPHYRHDYRHQHHDNDHYPSTKVGIDLHGKTAPTRDSA